MKKMINLDVYISLLGKLENLDIDKTFTTYCDRNQNKSIQSIRKGRITNSSFGNSNGVQLYTTNYNDGTSYEYSGMWIETEVEFDLSERYKL